MLPKFADCIQKFAPIQSNSNAYSQTKSLIETITLIELRNAVDKTLKR